jgi:hypothetical protein
MPGWRTKGVGNWSGRDDVIPGLERPQSGTAVRAGGYSAFSTRMALSFMYDFPRGRVDDLDPLGFFQLADLWPHRVGRRHGKNLAADRDRVAVVSMCSIGPIASSARAADHERQRAGHREV